MPFLKYFPANLLIFIRKFNVCISFRFLVLMLCTWTIPAISFAHSDAKIKTLYNSLDPTSLTQHLAFYELYSFHELGQRALKDVYQILNGEPVAPQDWISDHYIFPSPSIIQDLMTLMNKPLDKEYTLLNRETQEALLKLSNRLPHSILKGHYVWSEQEVLALPIEEIDLARGLFLSQFGENKARIQLYESLIDLMALQILARLPLEASPEEKIKVINAFIFDEMGFRFPPQSLYTKNIDSYTFLPSVLDSRRGVCLGVSILYLCLAQRLSLPLEIMTPPGHIYLRYHTENQEVNIETTARGIHIDSSEYLSVNTHSLQKRTIREVIGMAHFNQASVYWQNHDYTKALTAYQRAGLYLQSDPLLKELMGYILILNGNQEEGENILKKFKTIFQAALLLKTPSLMITYKVKLM